VIRTASCLVLGAGLALASPAVAMAAIPPGCGHLGPVADQYIDGQKLCRDAQNEILHSLRTGQQPNWAKAFRDSARQLPSPKPTVPKTSKRPRPRRPRPSHSPAVPRLPRTHVRPLKAAPVRPERTAPPPTHAQPLKAAPVRPKRTAPPPMGTESPQRNPSQRPTTRPSTTVTSRSVVPVAGTRHSSTDIGARKISWRWLTWAALLAVTLVVIYTGRRPSQSVLAAMSRILDRRAAAPLPSAKSELSWDPFALTALRLRGPGAESVLRGAVLEALRTGTEVIMTRSDACRLFSPEAGDLVDEQIPGLVLTRGTAEAIGLMNTAGVPRLLISCTTQAVLTDDAILRWPGLRSVLTLAAEASDTAVKVAENGALSWPAVTSPVRAIPNALPVLDLVDAYCQLAALPVKACQPDLYGSRLTPGTGQTSDLHG
jgi:hypothetical protein